MSSQKLEKEASKHSLLELATPEDSEDGEEHRTDSSEKRSDEEDSESGDVASESDDSKETTTGDESSEYEYLGFDESTVVASDLHLACIEGTVEDVERLISEDKSQLNCEDARGKTPLHYACRRKRVKIVKLLVKEGAELDAGDNDLFTPIHEAVSLEGLDGSGETSLESLKRREKRARKIVRILLDAGANGNLWEEPGNSTPLLTFIDDYFHCSKGQGSIPLKIIKMLFECGEESKEDLCEEGAEMAARFGDLKLLELCLQCGGDVDKMGESKWSLLHYAVRFADSLPEWQKCRTLRYLLDKGCSRIDYVCEIGTPLCEAASHGYLKCMDVLLSYGARIDVEQPLPHMAVPFVTGKDIRAEGANQNYGKIVEKVIQLGSAFDAETDSGISCLKFILDPNSGISCLKFILHHALMSYVFSDLEVQKASDFFNIILKENALKLPSRKGFLLTMKEAPDSRSRGFDIMKCPNFWVILHLYEVGYKIQEIEEMQDAQEDLTDEQREILDHIKEMDVLRLQQLCRLKIRRLLGSQLSAKVQNLSLPKPMQNYLCMM